MPPLLRTGTSGYSYKEWKGPFYPEKLAAKSMLAYYAERLSAVEINNTFYRMPKQSVLETWAEQVPPHFRFAIKASRRITHFKRLKDTAEEVGFLLGNLEALGERLGIVLFQLPPNLKCDLERLDTFLELLPEGTPAAFEFRHDSWSDAAVHERLRARNLARVTVDQEDAEEPEVETTASRGYFRLRRPSYDEAALRRWAQRISAAPLQEAFVFFKHEDAGAGPRMAGEFARLAEDLTRGPRAVRTPRPAADADTA